tara:strand:+ start:2573 stop:3934 length:1362 start_codon:yes stop_codon:yes gene_type:complete
MRQIDYVSTTALTPIDPYTQHGGGGFKKLVAVAAVIAIPIAAPTIAASIGLSGAIGSVMASGLVGAGLGAVAGQITGQGATKGALMGALSGGAAGYFSPGTTTTDTGTFQNQAFGRYETGAVDTGMLPSGPETMYSGVEDAVVADSGTVVTNPQGQTLVDGAAVAQDGTTAANLQTNQAVVEGGTAPINTAGPNVGLNQQVVTTPNAGAGANVVTTPKPVNPNPYADPKLTGNTFADTGRIIKARFTNPTNLADMSIQAGIQVLGSELLGVGDMSDEEKEMLELQKQRLQELKERDEKAYNFAMKQAASFLQQAKDYDPTATAKQFFAKSAAKLGMAKRDALRKISPQNAALRAAEERRFNLGIAGQTGSAYERGMTAGLKRQGDLYSKASATFPSGGGNYSAALTGLNETYANLARKRSEAQKGMNQMFGGFLTDGGDGNDDDDKTFKLVQA